MRHWIGLLLALALVVTGCSETAGTGGSAGDAGTGGDGGGGEGGSGGESGSGGTSLCGGVDCDDGDDCTADVCADAVCDYTPQPDGMPCRVGGELFLPGQCVAGSCMALCGGPVACCDNDADCNDYKDCTADTCLGSALCENVAVEDGTECAGGTCQGGECALTTTVLPCTEQGVRNALAAGGGPFTFACDGPTTVVTEAGFFIGSNVVLDGESKLVLDGNEEHRVFVVGTGVAAELRGLTVVGGFHRSRGGGIVNNRGTLTLTNCTVSMSRANGGGGIFNDRGTVTLMNSTVSGNTASGGDGGGGISSSGGTLTLTNSTVSGNQADHSDGLGGGGIYSYQTAVTLTNSTVSGNLANGGGGIRNTGQNGVGALTLTNSTVSGNTTTSFPDGAISIADSKATLTNSTVSGNTGRGIYTQFGPVTLTNSVVDGDCEIASCCPGGDIVSDGNNIESPGSTCGFDGPTDQVNVSAEDLKLGPLQDNGGPTETHTLGVGSVAIDLIPEAECDDENGDPLTSDQRGEPRPAGPACDVGAFELQP